MAITADNVGRYNELLEKVKAMMANLTYDELAAIESVTEAFLTNHSAFKPLTEEELFARIDRSLAQAARGECEDAEAVEAELAAEFGL